MRKFYRVLIGGVARINGGLHIHFDIMREDDIYEISYNLPFPSYEKIGTEENRVAVKAVKFFLGCFGIKEQLLQEPQDLIDKEGLIEFSDEGWIRLVQQGENLNAT